MKKITGALLSTGLFFSLPTYAQYSENTTVTPENTSMLTTYVKNFGAWAGYPLDTTVTPVFRLLDYTLSLAQTGQQTLNVFFAARLLNPSYKQFTTNSNYSSFNAQANTLFTNYKSPSTKNVSIVENFDQKTYQDDPVNQMLVNILKTANTDTCYDTDDSCMSKNKVMYTVLQDIMDVSTSDGSVKFPTETSYFNQDHISKYLNQLNPANLIGPLQYSEENDSSSTAVPSGNQELQAMNYIRNVTGAVLPPDFMPASDYTSLWQTAQKEITSSTTPEDIDAIKTARKDLMSYLLKPRVYASQSALVYSNFVNSMMQRMPQKVTSSDGATSTTTSQAFNEFIMATWRINSPGIPSGKQWVDQINNASAATTQKEMAIILSELNYQMHLNNQLLERILLTNSVIAVNSLTTNQPNSIATTTVTTGGS